MLYVAFLWSVALAQTSVEDDEVFMLSSPKKNKIFFLLQEGCHYGSTKQMFEPTAPKGW